MQIERKDYSDAQTVNFRWLEQSCEVISLSWCLDLGEEHPVQMPVWHYQCGKHDDGETLQQWECGRSASFVRDPQSTLIPLHPEEVGSMAWPHQSPDLPHRASVGEARLKNSGTLPNHTSDPWCRKPGRKSHLTICKSSSISRSQQILQTRTCTHLKLLLWELRPDIWGPDVLNLKQINNPAIHQPCSNATFFFPSLSHTPGVYVSVNLAHVSEHLEKSNFRRPLALKHWKVKHKTGLRNIRNMSVQWSDGDVTPLSINSFSPIHSFFLPFKMREAIEK